nr:protein transport protein Sec61 subunit gamma isoform X1 [Kogia breviceps]
MDQVMQFVEPSRQFVKDSIRLVKRCTKPDRKEFQKIAMATAIGFAIMGFIGFFVKLIHIPINNIIVTRRGPHPASLSASVYSSSFLTANTCRPFPADCLGRCRQLFCLCATQA